MLRRSATLVLRGDAPLRAATFAPLAFAGSASAPPPLSQRYFGEGRAKVLSASHGRFKYRTTLRTGIGKAIGKGHNEAIEKAAANLLRRPEKAADIIANLPMEERRRVALAWAMTELEEEFVKADKDKDGSLTYKEFKQWAFKAIETGPKRQEDVAPTRQQCIYVAIGACIPFMGFGFVDNGLMVLFGDVIDGTFGCLFGCSMLACAALGNAISNVFGMLLHGSIHRWSDKVGLPDPRLTNGQRKMHVVHNWSTFGSCVGVFVGCLLGMLPLLLMDQTKKEEERAHAKVHGEEKPAA